jgi:hypothetical protein
MGNIFGIRIYNIFNYSLFNSFLKIKNMENIVVIEKKNIKNKENKKEENFFDKNFYNLLQDKSKNIFTVHKITVSVVLVKFINDDGNFCVIYKNYYNDMVNYYIFAKFKLIRKNNTLFRKHAYEANSVGDLLDNVKKIYEYKEYYKIYDN